MKKIFIVAGEASGDLHAANLLRRIAELEAVEAFGVGGERLREVGLECLARSEELSVMGLAEVVRELPRLLRLSRRLRRQVASRRPDVAVLVDSPDFNLPLAGFLRGLGVPVVVYVSPQLWAWRAGRVRRMRRDVRKVLTILPFEVAFYESHGVAAEYVGHPLVDELAPVMADLPQRRASSLALLPGSRRHEVVALLPTMLEAVARLRSARPSLPVRVMVAPGLEKNLVRNLVGGADVELVDRDRHRELATCGAAVVASGTATLECALLDVPMVVGYRLHPLTYRLARRLVRVPHVALANLVRGERVVPELVQDEFSAAAVAAAAGDLLGEGGEEQRRHLAEIRARLGEPGASRRAAEAVLREAERAVGTRSC